MTLQEKYPKFYSHPEKYLGIEVQCIKVFTRPVGMGVMGFEVGEIIKLTNETYDWLKRPKILECVIPLFKPQVGEQFIEDLEVAATIACTKPNEHENMVFHTATDKHYVFRSTYNPAVRFFVQRGNISWAKWRNGNMGLDFDTAAYVDKLRELGYYI